LKLASQQSAPVAVVVRGVDSHGYPFMQTAQATRFSRTSVELAGIDCLNGAADVVTVEFNRRRCRYRVAWIGCDKDGRAGHARLESLDSLTFIFDSENGLLTDASPRPVPDAPKPIPASSPAINKTQTERRRFQRYAWGANSQVRKKGVPVNTPCKVSDISLGGCYVELMMPFPQETPVELDLF
jgi:PilZ domain